MDERTKSSLLDELYNSGEKFHGWDRSVFQQWSLSTDALRLIADGVRDGDRTLETGSGYSTIVFTVCGARHTAISPIDVEHERILGWCAERGVDTSGLEQVVDWSQDVLPTLGDEPLDFVLIDGDHQFPVPFLDWFFAAGRLRVGGRLMVDDTHIRTGEILRDFLKADSARWRVLAELPTTTLFERTSEALLDPAGWLGQPYCAETRRVPELEPSFAKRLRSRVRLRTRLRELRRRLGERQASREPPR